MDSWFLAALRKCDLASLNPFFLFVPKNFLRLVCCVPYQKSAQVLVALPGSPKVQRRRPGEVSGAVWLEVQLGGVSVWEILQSRERKENSGTEAVLQFLEMHSIWAATLIWVPDLDLKQNKHRKTRPMHVAGSQWWEKKMKYVIELLKTRYNIDTCLQMNKELNYT